MGNTPLVCCCGEAMIELAGTGEPGVYRRGVAGDSYNTAIYLARAGLPVEYFTRLGDDELSDAIIAQLQGEGVGTAEILRCPNRQPGLYMIANDDGGERRFSYWRGESPARETFRSSLAPREWGAFYFTGITLAVTRDDIANLVALLKQLRRDNRTIIFDPNYRARLWDSVEQARDHYRQVLGLCDILLPTLDDEKQLWGIESVDQCAAMYLELDVGELVIKGENLTSHVYHGDRQWSRRAQPVAALDTTGAGDAFNAGYLASRLQGGSIESALEAAQQLSARVVRHHGAILPRG